MLSLQTFTTLVSNMAAAVQGACSSLLDLTVGSVLRAILEAAASVQLWLQYLILTVLQAAFLSTCTGTQVDNWLAQNFPAFGGRLPATYATGSVTFSRFSPAASALVPVGAQCRTADGTQTFTVTAQTTNALWNAAGNGYLIPAGTASGTVPVIAVNGGTQGNVAANTISLIVGSIPNVDTANNAAAFTNGVNAESDAAVKLRFQNWQETRASGTYAAVEAAISNLQANLTYTIAPNQTANGTYTPGTFTVSIDDGSGDTPSGTVTLAATAANAVRPIGSTAVVQAASALLANVSLTLTVGSGYSVSAAQAAVSAAISAYIGSLAVGATMPYSKISPLAWGAYAGITNVTGITLNGGTADLTPTASQVVRAGTIAT